MPRLSVFHPTGRGQGWNEPVDYCRLHYPNLRRAQAIWGDEVDMDNEHPDYELDYFTCEECGRTLGDRDN